MKTQPVNIETIKNLAITAYNVARYFKLNDLRQRAGRLREKISMDSMFGKTFEDGK